MVAGPARADDGPMERIVVGVDGSDHSRTALEWAVGEARLRGAQLDVVHVWLLPAYAYGAGLAMPVPIDRGELQQDAEELLDRIVDSVDTTGVEVNRIAMEGTAARCLVEVAQGASLLVVGSRGRGGFTGLLLGSVSQQVAHHAPCPVVIVR